MQPVKIENLPNKIKSTYQQFKNGQATIQDVANFFKIPIDASRLNDYGITKIDIDLLAIEIIDTRTNTIFTATYSKNSETLGMMAYVEEISFINVTAKNSLYERRTDYRISEEIPVLETLTIRNGKYGLLFKKTMPGVINNLFLQDGMQFLVMYFTQDNNVEDELPQSEYGLLGSVYKTNYLRKNINSFEQLFVYDNPMTYDKNTPNHFCFDIEGNLIVGSNSDSNPTIEGACFEAITDDNLNEVFSNFTLPGKDSLKDISHIIPSQMESAILYAGYSYSNKIFRKMNIDHDLEISKTGSNITIKYSLTKRSYSTLKTKVIGKSYVIPILEIGNITIAEIDSIINELQTRFSNDDFIQFVIQDLLIFQRKLAIKNGLESEVLNPLSPKLLMDKTFDEITEEVCANKEQYFSLMASLFDSIVNMKPTEDRQIRTRRPIQSQSNEN